MDTKKPGPTTTATATSSLRRSCAFCRSRKIRCSGGQVCTACRERNANCVYNPEAKKGRPKRKAPCQTAPSTTQSDSVEQPLFPSPSRAAAGDDELCDESPGANAHDHPSLAVGTHTLGHDLDHMFDEYFIRKSGSRSNIFQNSIASFHKRSPQSPAEHSQHQPPILASDGQLSFLAQEMVEMLLLRVGNLGCEEPDQANRKFFVSSLAADSTLTMFDAPVSQINPISTLGKHRVLQLVDVWFSTHPISSLISKTLLIDGIKDDTVDVALLAAIMADACEIHRNTGGKAGPGESHDGDDENPRMLLQFAAAQLNSRPLILSDPTTLSTAQALILIGWRELGLGHARRGTCYIGYTCNAVSRLNQLWKSGARGSRMALNGVDVAEVEQEMLRNTYWLCLSTTTWAFMQIDQPFSLLVPDEIPDFPSLDETTSAVLRLDRASGNISTLPAQIRSMQQLWPLSHVTSTVAHIYTLHLNAATKDQGVRAVPWQKQYIHQLQHLLQSGLHPSMLSLEIRGILLQAIQAVEREVSNIAPLACLLTTYHTIVIHMLYPKTLQGEHPLQISQAFIYSICHSMSAILGIAQKFMSTPPTTDYGRVTVGVSTLVLALDTCSRALLYIHEQSGRGSMEEYSAAVAMRKELSEYAEQLYRTCKIDLLSLKGSVIRPIKKRLKELQQAFGTLGAATDPQQHPILTGSDCTVSSVFPQESYMNPARVDMPLVSPSFPDPSDFGFQYPGPIEDPCSFVSEPGIGSLLGFPAFTKFGSSTCRTGRLAEGFGAQRQAFTHPEDDALQYCVPGIVDHTRNQLDGIVPTNADMPHLTFHNETVPTEASQNTESSPPDTEITASGDECTINLARF